MLSPQCFLKDAYTFLVQAIPAVIIGRTNRTRKRFVIPFIRVQNTDTRQGPLLRMMGLASVTISTAAGSMEIPGLPAAEAETLRDQAAEFARLAKEDV